MSAAQRLATLLADFADRAARGQHATLPEQQVEQLVTELHADPEARELTSFFELMAGELRARGLKLPPSDQLPASVAPLVAAVDGAFAPGPDGQPDLEASLDRMDAAFMNTFGTSPRQIERDRLRDQIRSEVGDSIARSMRRHGLTPARDMRSETDPDET